MAHGVRIAMKDPRANIASTYKLQEIRVPTNILQGHDEIVWAVVVCGDRLFSASADKTIRVWDVTSRRCEQVHRIEFRAPNPKPSGRNGVRMWRRFRQWTVPTRCKQQCFDTCVDTPLMHSLSFC